MKTISWRVLVGVIFSAVVLLAQPGNSQEIILDSVSGFLPGSTTELKCGQVVEFVFRLRNPGDAVTGSSNGFRLYSPDGATWNPAIFVDTTIILFPPPAVTTLDTSYYGRFVNPPSYAGLGLKWKGIDPQIYDGGIFVSNASDDDANPGTPDDFGSGSDTTGFAGFVQQTGTGIFMTFDDIGWKLVVASFDCSSHNKTICVDSAFYFPTGYWKWSTGPGDVFPNWAGPYCYTIKDPNAPASISVTPDSLHFSAVAGGGNPAAQNFIVSSDGAVAFTLTEDAPWLQVSPTAGTTPRTISTSVNISGRPSGNYIDTIRVDAPGVPNSPQFVVVTMTLTPPPPIIGVTPSALFFNAVAGEPNPPAKILTIKNIGGSVLNWTATNSETWLSLNPGAGIDSVDVSVEVDITGLPFGEYDDTIVVTDPNATNDPRRVPVHLSIGSDLPIIVVDSLFNTVIVPFPSTSVPPRKLSITNGGQGSMTYRLEETTPRIQTIVPDSGSAPDSVQMNFKVTGAYAIDGATYTDTVWVYSDEAINSPVPVVVSFLYRSNPKNLFVFPLSLNINYFECTQGTTGSLPTRTIAISNVGGDNPLKFHINYESDYFTLNRDSGNAPQNVTLTMKDFDAPVGTYFDTIQVTALGALNSPRDVIVQINVISGTATPWIELSSDSLVVVVQENVGTTFPISVVFDIDNRFGGCMEWSIDENVGWMVSVEDSGQVPATAEMLVSADGYTLGNYLEEFFVVAPLAGNSPRRMVANLLVWRYRGDLDWDGIINIADLTYFVRYSFMFGAEPKPEKWVADLDCNHQINIVDLAYLVSYMFKNGPKPCTNP